MNEISWTYGNIYYKNRKARHAVTLLLRGKPDACVIAEAGAVARFVAKWFPGYRAYIAPYGESRGRTDLIILVKKSLRHELYMTVIGSRGFKGVKGNHDRQVVAVGYYKPGFGKAAIVGLHPSPGPDALAGDEPDHPIVKQYSGYMRSARRVVSYLRNEGFAVVAVGDVQMHPTQDSKPWSPNQRMAGHMEVAVWQHLDITMIDKNLEAVGPLTGEMPFSMAETGSDHPFLRGAARLRRRRS